MRFVASLTLCERQTLRELLKNHTSYKARIRAHAILLSSEGRMIEDIRLILFIEDRDSIANWYNRWEKAGLVGLFDRSRFGRPELLDNSEQLEAMSFAKKSPQNLRAVLPEVQEKIGKSFSFETLKRVLKKHGFRWRRARKSLKNKRDEQAFVEAKTEIETLKEAHRHGEIDLRYFDESGIDLTPVIPYAWQLKATPIELPSERSQRINILGFMNLDCEVESYVFNCSVISDVVVRCFDDFVKKISKPTHVIIDNASIHTSFIFQDKIKEWEKKNLFIKFLPAYSPELNLIEILWRFIKYKWIELTAYKSIKTLNDSVDNVLKNIGKKYRITFA